MAIVLKRDSELARISKRIKRKEKIRKATEPIRRFLDKILFVLFTLCIIAFTTFVCYAVIQAIKDIHQIGAYITCGVVVILGVCFEIRAGKVCLGKKENKKPDPQIKGAEGEEAVTKYIEENFSNDYYLLNDINVRCNGKSSQFDHILVGPQGIFCLETKNYSGSYSPSGESWMFYNGTGRAYMESPQYQSFYHASVLAELMHKEKRKIIPLVVFANKKAKYNGGNKPCPVIYFDKLKEEVCSHDNVYSKKEMKKIAKKILSLDVGISRFKEKKR